MFPDHGFSAMVNNNITRTAKQLPATLVKVLAELFSSKSCRNDPLFIRGFQFLRQWWRRCWPGVIWQCTFNEAIHQDEHLASNNDWQWISMKPNTKSYRTNYLKMSQLSQNVPTISKCPNYFKMSQLSQNVPNISKCPNSLSQNVQTSTRG